MNETQPKQNRKVILGAIIAAVLVIAALAAAYFIFSPKPAQGSKAITVVVVDNNGKEKSYSHKTDAEYLLGALKEIKGFEISGSDSEYGLFVTTVNGVTAGEGGSYWAFYVNDSYCNYGVDSQPVYDGDAFRIVYEVWAG